MSTHNERTVAALLKRHGSTLAEEAGIRLGNTPAPLWQLLTLSGLISARISASIAVSAARELFGAGLTTPQKMLDSPWQGRVDALGRGGYRRYDESTATRLGDIAGRTIDRCGGDLRRLRDEARHDGGSSVADQLQEFKGIGPSGAAFFCREVQGVWPELAPDVDELVGEGAARLGLPRTPDRQVPALVAGCVRAARSDAVVDEVKQAVG